jgi:hypothetical protein
LSAVNLETSADSKGLTAQVPSTEPTKNINNNNNNNTGNNMRLPSLSLLHTGSIMIVVC